MAKLSLRVELRDNVRELWKVADAAETASLAFASEAVVSDAYDDLARSFNSVANELQSYLISSIFDYADWELRNVAEQLEKAVAALAAQLQRSYQNKPKLIPPKPEWVRV